ncbi:MULTISPECIES: pyridoxal phosphate-dependent decarboxylase family protein [unclassified Polaribacter]|uniref:pyridoxal phosphate-dependent decarboxylase family protein n=1 Tax=unclassified Polaribacter TaxID=196858 RepID=UPI0011BE25F9|nr:MULTISPECIES: aspartate aminotransferase family protein [unclassified Polaribacter]TXD50617.1 aspartate aminotransferase family protein [Polaribacter sp. IC063]TXD57280.1 aspartate aminotransferase family protein [Polaribacter sp. IC066]
MKPFFDISLEEMKTYGYKIVDLIAEHYNEIENKKPVTTASREEMDTIFLQEAPEKGMPADKVLDFVMDKVIPNSNITSHPKAFSFVPGPSNFISTMADSLATGFNIFSGGWIVSPAAAELEIVTINWLLKMFNFPVTKGGGIFTSGGSIANLTALAAARRIKCGDDFSKAIIYLSDQAHSSNIKAIRILGLKKEQIKIIPTDVEFKISINKLKNEIAKDQLQGKKPFCIIASAGTTNTGTVDPLYTLADICEKENLWFHIDAAYGGAAILSEKGSKILQGIERADSLTVDPHKWFFQPYEIGCLLVKDASWLSNTFSEKPEYLRDIEGNESEINFYDYGIQLTRRFRALKFYMSIKTYGLETFKAAISYNIDLAEKTEDLLRKSKNWEIVSPAALAIINFRYNPLGLNLSNEKLDKLNQEVSARVVASQEALLVTTVLQNQVVIRMCLINPKTTLNHIKETLDQCNQFANEVLDEWES